MKTFLLILTTFTLAITALHAQVSATPAVPPEAAAVTSLLPTSWQGYATIALVLLPLLGRAYHALQTNGGLKGVWNAIIFGTNTPGAKVLLASLCLLSLTSCAGLMTFIASPLGQTALITAETLGKQLAKATEERVLEQIILKATSTATALTAQGVNKDVAKEIVRQSELAGLQAVSDTAQNQYVGLTGHKFTAPKNPLPIPVSPAISFGTR